LLGLRGVDILTYMRGEKESWRKEECICKRIRENIIKIL